ncbi:MAG: hypothetical protein GY716_03745 [bacterium]|nr:hypothetical protein [bacterium]
MSESQTFQRRTQDALEDHRQIHFYLDQIALRLEELGSDDDDVEPMRRLAAQLEGLKERLVEHHEAEEEGGLFQSILEVMPEARLDVARLTRQHGKMIEILEMARIHAQCGEPGEADGLRRDLEGFLETFREHERTEEELLRRAIARESRVPE